MIRIFNFAALMFALFTYTAHASEVLSTYTETFVNSDCESNQSCDLKKVTFRLRVKQNQKDASPETEMVLNYQTDTVAHLEEFGVAQFIRGCQFTSELDQGEVKRYQNIQYDRDRTRVRYVFPSWQIDGHMQDPLGWDAAEVGSGSRINSYLDRDPDLDTRSGPLRYGAKKPSVPILWVQDYPGVGKFSSVLSASRNVSLQFKTCIYRASDVPREVAYDQVDFAEPLHCFEWSDSSIYNFESKQFDSPKNIDPYCQANDDALDK
jgi:hypothetical protein